MSLDPFTLTLFVVYGLWLLTLSVVLAGVRAEQAAIRIMIAELKTDLKVEAIQTRQDLASVVRTEIAYALLGARSTQTQWNVDAVYGAQAANLGNTYNNPPAGPATS